MSYTVCPNCGQNALSVATRCPRCGLPFEEQFMGRAPASPKPRRAPLVLLMLGVVVAMLGANALLRRLSLAPPPSTTRAKVATPAPAPPRPVPPPASESLAPVVESLGATPPPPPRPPRETLPPRLDRVLTATPSVTAAPRAIAETVATERRVASTWMNVRSGRSNSAPVLRILRPGEAVEVDLLERGWYRVLSADRQPAGYVDRRLLAPSPATASP